MQTLDRDQVSMLIDAPAEAVYELVADVTRTPEFSPEIIRCTWLDGAAGPAAGARFEAVNKVTRGPSWKNRPVVIAARRGGNSPSRAPRSSPAPWSGGTSSSQKATAPG
jgi:hypothetical protein